MSDDVQKPEPPNMAWLLTFADLVSLLITFFVLLYSMKTVDESRWDMIYGSLTGVFAPKEAVIFVHPEEFKSAEVINVQSADDLLYLESILLQTFNTDRVLKTLKTHYNPAIDILTITLPSDDFYSSGSARLSIQGRVAMMKLADKLRHLDNKVQVVGYTDSNFKPTSEFPSSWEIALERALNATRIMNERGMPAPLIAFANGNTLQDNNTPRVEVLIYGEDE